MVGIWLENTEVKNQRRKRCAANKKPDGNAVNDINNIEPWC